jgi:hypothetical protein
MKNNKNILHVLFANDINIDIDSNINKYKNS